MKIAIIGWGVEGRSVFEYFGPEHEYLIVNEHPRDDFPPETDRVKLQFLSTTKPIGITGNVTDLSYLNGVNEYDKIVYTPTSIKNLKLKFGSDSTFWAKATSALKIFFENVNTTNVIGITGTKGKGTTSMLVFKILEATGKKVHLGGNIGVSVLDFVRDIEPQDWVVLELSSFQLYELSYSPHIGVCLMIAPEHMDWHSSMEDYVEAKSNIFRHQKTNDIAVYFSQNNYSTQIANLSQGTKIPYYASPGAYVNNAGIVIINDEEIINKNAVKLLGEHNLQNICAAVTTVWQVHQDADAIRSVLSTFSGLEHRLEFVRELEGVKYYDDSFGTTPETAIVAMRSFSQPKVVILGGSDKGARFDDLAQAVMDNNVKHTVVIGDIAEKITAALSDKGYKNISTGFKAMPEIVEAVKELAEPGDVVLLSTGAASFGMFKNYKDRGEQFKKSVQSLT